ncbi:MAG: flagellar basal body L-ring protein FlgH [Succinivibrionaceae bacterium]
MNRFIKVLCLGVIVLSTGCSMVNTPTPDDPNYAPAMPEEQIADIVPDGSIFKNARMNNLYSDIKAHRVGDIISVELNESTSANKNSSTTTAKNSTDTIDPLGIGGLPVTIKGYNTSASLNAERKFDGNAKAAQSNSLKGNISVSVIKVLSNGGLVVRGEKWVSLTNGSEYIRITGIVRSEDVKADNTVSSQKIANARIQYGGTGDFAESTEKGWLSKFFNSKWMPF